jgi:hypothetical protein
MHLLATIAEKINALAPAYKVGGVQKTRKKIGKLSRLPSKVLFDRRTVFEDWGWHYGGRREMQFNIGLEGDLFRYGVAFSLERSQSLPAIDILFPKISLFNEYIAEYGERYLDLRMWRYVKGKKSELYLPGPISKEMINEGTFIFLGATQNKENIDYALVLETLDRLFPLYLHTEGDSASEGFQNKSFAGFVFKAGCARKPSATGGSQKEKALDILLRHNDIQYALYERMCLEYGHDNVGAEINVDGLSIDLVVKVKGEYWFYEIKTASSAKACIRQGLGQILEYSYWPGHQVAARLIIVGEPKLTSDEEMYLSRLRNEMSIPVEYMVIDLND